MKVAIECEELIEVRISPHCSICNSDFILINHQEEFSSSNVYYGTQFWKCQNCGRMIVSKQAIKIKDEQGEINGK